MAETAAEDALEKYAPLDLRLMTDSEYSSFLEQFPRAVNYARYLQIARDMEVSGGHAGRRKLVKELELSEHHARRVIKVYWTRKK